MNRLSALGESVSFGRFMSESLDWGKWSSFNHNKYLEEAERYSRPGSVAQKKAYFEAHYKRNASLKKAESEEQESNHSFDTGDMNSSDAKAESEEPNCEAATSEVRNYETVAFETKNSDLGEEFSPSTADGDPVDSSLLISSSGIVEAGEDQNEISEIVVETICIFEKEPLKEIGNKSEKKRRVPMSKSAFHGLSKLSSSPGTKSSPVRKMLPLYCIKENSSCTPRSRNKDTSFNETKKSAPKKMHMSMNFRHEEVGVANPSRTKNSSLEQLDQFKTPTRIGSSKGIPNTVLGTPESDKKSYSKSVGGVKGRSSYTAVSSSPLHVKKIDEKAEKDKKEKDDSELKEFRKNLCFKARPLPDFYRKIEPSKDANKKVTSAHPPPPIAGRSSCSTPILEHIPPSPLKTFYSNTRSITHKKEKNESRHT